MEQPQRTCYIHIGTHKTGTTSIQAFLALNRDRFRAHGVFWPVAGSDGDPGVASHHELARELCGSSAFRPERGGLAAVAAELRASDARVALLSSEDLTFLWDKPAALQHLREAIRSAGFTPRVVAYLRPQASYCTAVYAENVRHGYRTAFAAYLADVVSNGQYAWGSGCGPPFDYLRLLDPFAAIFGRDAIIVRRYAAGAADNALLVSFARLLLPPNIAPAAFDMPSVRLNGSLDFGGVLALLGQPAAVTQRLRFTPLGVTATLRLGLRFLPSNVAVAARYGVCVPPFEALDLALALPLRRTRAKTRAVRAARRALSTAHAAVPRRADVLRDVGDGEEMIVDR